MPPFVLCQMQRFLSVHRDAHWQPVKCAHGMCCKERMPTVTVPPTADTRDERPTLEGINAMSAREPRGDAPSSIETFAKACPSK